ncbi:MAG: hypothetical protein JEZ07_13295 [Phycisphaerae bacterium]|nr:hypothetical protein [Phycisphaerae bacterium]
MNSKLIELQIFHLNDGIDSIVVAALLADGTIGFGQGIPAGYAGETIENAIFAAKTVLAESLKNLAPKTITHLYQKAYDLPYIGEDGNIIHAARCAVELALLDAYGKYFKSDLTSLVDWLGFGKFTATDGSIHEIKPTITLDGNDPAILKTIRKHRFRGISDFKLNTYKNFLQTIRKIYNQYQAKLQSGQMTLRFDAKGQWDVDTALATCQKMDNLCICSVEQPLAIDDNSHWLALSDLTGMILTADESLVKFSDGRYLAENQLIDCFDIKISKNGGLLPAIRLAELAGSHEIDVQLGKTTHESSILAAAGKRFLQQVPGVVFTEIGVGLSRHDIAMGKNNTFFNKYQVNEGFGLGISVEIAKISKIIVANAHKVNFE